MHRDESLEFTLHLRRRIWPRARLFVAPAIVLVFLFSPYLASLAGVAFGVPNAWRLWPPSVFVVCWVAVGLGVVIPLVVLATRSWSELRVFGAVVEGGLRVRLPLGPEAWAISGLDGVGVPIRVSLRAPRYVPAEVKSGRLYAGHQLRRPTRFNAWITLGDRDVSVPPLRRRTYSEGEGTDSVVEEFIWVMTKPGDHTLWIEHAIADRPSGKDLFDVRLRVIGERAGEYSIRAEAIRPA